MAMYTSKDPKIIPLGGGNYALNTKHPALQKKPSRAFMSWLREMERWMKESRQSNRHKFFASGKQAESAREAGKQVAAAMKKVRQERRLPAGMLSMQITI